MEISKIKRINPGDEVPPSTLHSHNGKALVHGDLISVNSSYFICSKSKRYLPNKDDIVIGRIIHRSADFYRIDLGYGITGFLPELSFYLATKRNKPELKVNEYVMARVVRVKDVPMLECENGMGRVDGYIFDLGCYNVKRILVQNLLENIGKEYNFKMGMGVNGIVWIWNENALIVREIVDKIKEKLGITSNK